MTKNASISAFVKWMSRKVTNPPMKEVTFLPKYAIEMSLKIGNLISLLDPEEEVKYLVEPERLLSLRVHDIEEYIPDHTLFSISNAKAILAFVRQCGEQDIVVHCHAGRSRSAAVAKFLSDKLGYRLNLNRPCVGSIDSYNGHIYRTLNNLYTSHTHYALAEAEMEDRSRGYPKFIL